MKKPSVIALFIILAGGLFAQQEPQFNLYMFNRVGFNPATAGLDRAVSVTGYGRNQWLGYKNDSSLTVSPRTYGLSFDMPVYKIKSGAGLTFQYGKTGVESNVDIKLHYAYHQVIKKHHTVSFGLSLGFLSKSIDYSQVIPAEEDPMLPKAKESGFMTDIDLGLHYQAFKTFNLGFSVTNLLGSSAEIGAPEFTQARHIYLYSDYALEIAPGSHHNMTLTPGVLVKATTGAAKIDLNAILTYDELFWGGIVYRLPNAAGIMAGINFQGLKVGISYDYTMNANFAKKSRSSVEFLVRYSYSIYPPVIKRSGYNTRDL